jgi:hypothetical protein
MPYQPRRMVRPEEPAMNFRTSGSVVAIIAGAAAQLVLAGYILKASSDARPAPAVITIDNSAAIAAAIRAANPTAPAPTIIPAPVTAAAAAPAPVAKAPTIAAPVRKIKRKAKTKPAPVILRTVYFVAPRCGCAI